jgi:hypothetical protein
MPEIIEEAPVEKRAPVEQPPSTAEPTTIVPSKELPPELPKAESKTEPSAEETKKISPKNEPILPGEQPAVRKEAPKELRLPQKRKELRTFDTRDRQGLRDTENRGLAEKTRVQTS